MARNKRFHRELIKLLDEGYDVKYCDEEIITLHIKQIGRVTIHNTLDYPFKKPLIMINGLDYRRLLRSPSKRFDKILKKNFNVCCMECQSYLCDHKWNVSVTMKMILNEVIEKNKKSRDVFYWI